MSNKILRVNDFCRSSDNIIPDTRISSKIEIYNEEGELIFEPLHNKTVIAGSALVAMKLFNLNKSVLNNTPTYDSLLQLYNNNDNATIQNEMERKIVGFCVGRGGSGIGISDVYSVKYCDFINQNDIIPFRYPKTSEDTVNENIYKGKKVISNNSRTAYYFKTFENESSIALVQNYTNGGGNITSSSVYTNTASANNAQSYIELNLQISKDDCREFFIAHDGLENARINQISLVSAWTKQCTVNDKIDDNGNNVYEYFQDIRPFSLLNIPNDSLIDISKSISIIYTLYF